MGTRTRSKSKWIVYYSIIFFEYCQQYEISIILLAATHNKPSEMSLLQGGNARFLRRVHRLQLSQEVKLPFIEMCNPLSYSYYACNDKIEAFEFSPDKKLFCVQMFSM